MPTVREKLEVMKRAIEACPWKYQEQWAEHMIAYSDKEEYP